MRIEKSYTGGARRRLDKITVSRWTGPIGDKRRKLKVQKFISPYYIIFCRLFSACWEEKNPLKLRNTYRFSLFFSFSLRVPSHFFLLIITGYNGCHLFLSFSSKFYIFSSSNSEKCALPTPSSIWKKNNRKNKKKKEKKNYSGRTNRILRPSCFRENWYKSKLIKFYGSEFFFFLSID